MNLLGTTARPAIGFVIAATITACIIQSAPPAGPSAPPSPEAPRGAEESGAEIASSQPALAAGVANGEYLCSFTSGDYVYPEFPCIVYARRDGRQILEKVGGSQRIHGLISNTDDGFDFEGTFYCPWGSCTEQVGARFITEGSAIYRGTLSTQSGPVIVSLRFVPGGLPRSYGGYGYAGRTYGMYGVGYGGLYAPR